MSGPLTPEDVPFSWRPGCPVPPGQLRAIYLSYAGFDGRAHTGQIIVNASVVHQVIEVFSLLYRARFPISRMEPVDVFHGSDPRSMAADNTSGFNCRSAVASGPPRWSMHAYGLAIDVNTIQKSSAARRVTGHRTDKAGKRMPNELFCASITSRSRLLNQVQNQRYTGDPVKWTRRFGVGGHGVGSPKSSSPSLTPRRKTNRCRSARRASMP